jgi:phosphoglucan,water dikinase
VLTHELPHLSHLGVRARQAGVIFATCEEATEFERLQKLDGQMISFLALADTVAWESANESAQPASEARRPRPQIPAVRLHARSPWIPLEEAAAEIGGGKAAGARRLAELSRRDGSGFATPAGIVVPFGVLQAQLESAPALAGEYRQLIERLSGLPAAEFPAVSQHLRELVQRLDVPAAITSEVAQRFAKHGQLMVRSSANCEDLQDLAGAGLYDSVMNVNLADVASAIRTVWSSLWTRRAALSRQQARIAHDQVHMAVLIQEMVVPDFSFVLHTINPINQLEQELYAEIAVGLGDALASAAISGSPYRMVGDKNSGATTMLAFANLSQASRPNPEGGLRRETVDYSRVELSRDETARKALGRRLTEIGRFVQAALQRPQDIEGVVAGDRIYLVQTRAQQGLAPRETT